MNNKIKLIYRFLLCKHWFIVNSKKTNDFFIYTFRSPGHNYSEHTLFLGL